MKVLSLIYQDKKNAGPKAKRDIDKILEKEYGAKIIKLYRVGNFRIKTLLTFVRYMFSKDILVLQMPMILKSAAYRVLPKNRTILLVHDIDGLRHMNEEVLNKEINIFKQFKYVIVHNEKMKDFLIEKGVDKDCLYVLGLFDYLVENQTDEVKEDENDFFFVGNLDKEKSTFIYQFKDGELSRNVNLYGLNVKEDELDKKLIYKGSFEPENLSGLEGKVGIIWDGSKEDDNYNDPYKNYTRYNNPHKLSCYMACGKPVVVWEEAACANFVEKNDVGYKIKKLEDINKIDFSDYETKKKNAEEIQKKVISGEYTREVFKTIISKIET